MNPNDLKVADLMKLMQVLSEGGATAPTPTQHPMVGEYVICRCGGAGVHAGTLHSFHAGEAHLRNSRRLWSWEARKGVALSGLAQHGLKGGKIDTNNPDIYLTGVVEIIPCSPAAATSIIEAD